METLYVSLNNYAFKLIKNVFVTVFLNIFFKKLTAQIHKSGNYIYVFSGLYNNK